MSAEHWKCPDCGPHVSADEDGCCAACGSDCASEPCDCVNTARNDKPKSITEEWDERPLPEALKEMHRIEGARLALEAAAGMIRAEINERYAEGCVGRWGSEEAQLEHRIRSLSPESIVKEGKP